MKKYICPLAFIIVIVLCFVYIKHNAHNSSANNELIINEIKNIQGTQPTIQIKKESQNINIGWAPSALSKIKSLSDKLLPTLIFKGSIEDFSVKKHLCIEYPNIKIFIPYDTKNPEKQIVIAMSNNYYNFTGGKAEIQDIIKWLKSEKTI